MKESSLENKAKEYFKGRIIYKPHIRNLYLSEQVPGYVLEYLFRKFCPQGYSPEGINKIKEVLRKLHVAPKEREKVKQDLREHGQKKILDEFQVNTDLSRDMNFVRIPCLDVNNALIDESLFEENENLLCGGMWGIAIITYIKDKRSLKLTKFEPLQIGKISIEKYFNGRKNFELNEWIDLLINTIGYNPKIYNQEEKLLILSRLLPLVENNLNIVELGPRNTGKTYIFKNISYYSKVITGNISPAQLFYNLQSRTNGLIAVKESIVFDEAQTLKLSNPDETMSKLKDYMNDGSFERGGKVKRSNCSIVFVANIDVDANTHEPNIIDNNYFSVLPYYIGKNTAFLERIHGLLPGWRLARLQHSEEQLSNSYGLMSDYFCEILHQLRKFNYISDLKSSIDYDNINMDIRDEKAILRIIDGFIKILDPHNPSEPLDKNILNIVKDYAVKYRQYIYNSLRELNKKEYPPKIIKLEFK